MLPSQRGSGVMRKNSVKKLEHFTILFFVHRQYLYNILNIQSCSTVHVTILVPAVKDFLGRFWAHFEGPVNEKENVVSNS